MTRPREQRERPQATPAVRVALTGVARAARCVAERADITAAHEIAAADLANLRRSIAALDHHTGADELWAVYVFAARLCAPNEYPDLTGGATDRVTGPGTPSRRNPMRHLAARRSRAAVAADLEALRDAVRAADAVLEATINAASAPR
jgi:hypothetical protein